MPNSEKIVFFLSFLFCVGIFKKGTHLLVKKLLSGCAHDNGNIRIAISILA